METQRKNRLEWEMSERETRRERFRALRHLLKGMQSPEGTHSALKFSEYVKRKCIKDIKIPKLSDGEDIQSYFIMSYKFPESKWVARVAPCLT